MIEDWKKVAELLRSATYCFYNIFVKKKVPQTLIIDFR